MRSMAILVLVALTAITQAQTSFEVASVKPTPGGTTSMTTRSGKGSFLTRNQGLRLFIVQAYRVRPDRVVGGPAWIDTARFDITARAPEGTPDDQIPLMLRTLLADRFKLAVHTEMRDQPVYALVLANSDRRLGPKLKASDECDKNARMSLGGRMPSSQDPTPQILPCGTGTVSDARGTTITGGARPLSDLARTLETPTERSVVDRTGLTGTYNFELRFTRPNLQGAGQDSDLPVLFSAIQEQLGLKLESQRGPVEFLVIDRIEQPTPD